MMDMRLVGWLGAVHASNMLWKMDGWYACMTRCVDTSSAVYVGDWIPQVDGGRGHSRGCSMEVFKQNMCDFEIGADFNSWSCPALIKVKCNREEDISIF